jgi:glycerophosphoryl diester phosphodiesterase
MLKFGHRGAKGYVTENTIPSIQKALTLSIDGIEIDVHLCKSGELVVFHDFTLDRLTNGSGEISTFTLKELKNLKVNNEYSIPTLQEVLDIIDASAILNIELKGEHTAKKACEAIHKNIKNSNWKLEDFIVSSFQEKELEKVFEIDKTIRLGVLTKASINSAITFANTINAYAIHPNIALISKNNVQKTQQLGYKVYTWTVNNTEAINRAKRYGVDAIISDVPDLL